MKYDLFISHDVKDRSGFTTQLVLGLKQSGLKVWYSSHDLKPGDDLPTEIKWAMDNSRFGLPIFTSNYMESNWGMQEFNYLMIKEKIEKRKVIIPIWHNITLNEIIRKMPMEANRFAINSNKGIDRVVQNVNITIRKQLSLENSHKKILTLLSFSTIFITSGLFYLSFKEGKIAPNKKQAIDLEKTLPAMAR